MKFLIDTIRMRERRAFVGYTLTGLFVGPWLSPVNAGVVFHAPVAVVVSIYAMVLARSIFYEDEGRAFGTYLRALPVSKDRVFATRVGVGLGLVAASFAIQLAAWYLGATDLVWRLWGELGRSGRVYYEPPLEALPILAAWVFCAFGAGVWFTHLFGVRRHGREAGVLGWLSATALTFLPRWIDGPVHSYLPHWLFGTGVLALAGAWRLSLRREVAAASDEQWMLGARRPVDVPFVLAATGATTLVPLAMCASFALFLTRGFFPGTPTDERAVALMLAVGIPAAAFSARQVRARALGLARGLAVVALNLTGLGHFVWRSIRDPRPAARCTGCAGPRLVSFASCPRCGGEEFTAVARPRSGRLSRATSPMTIVGGIMVLVLAGSTFLGSLRLVHAWTIEARDPETEILLDGRRIGVGTAGGWSFGPPLGRVGFLHPSEGLVTWAPDDGPHDSLELGTIMRVLGPTPGRRAALEEQGYRRLFVDDVLRESFHPSERLELRVDGRAVAISTVNGQAYNEPGHTVAALHVLGDVPGLLEAAEDFVTKAGLGTLEDADYGAALAWGDPFYGPARRTMLARLRYDSRLRDSERRYSLPDEQAIAMRERQLAALDALIARRYELEGSGTDALERIWAELEARVPYLGPLGESHFNDLLQAHFSALYPQLRGLALAAPAAPGFLPQRIAAGSPHAALAAGLAGDPAAYDACESALDERLDGRLTRGGGLFELSLDSHALAYGWALFAIDRERATEKLVALLGRADPTPVELLFLNGRAPIAEDLQRWIDAPDHELVRRWRLRDARTARELRQRFRRALQGTEFEFLPIDYFEQSAGFLCFVPQVGGE